MVVKLTPYKDELMKKKFYNHISVGGLYGRGNVFYFFLGLNVQGGSKNNAWNMQYALSEPQEIDIDDFAFNYLGLSQDFQYLSHNGMYLGMMVFKDTKRFPYTCPIKTRRIT